MLPCNLLFSVNHINYRWCNVVLRTWNHGHATTQTLVKQSKSIITDIIVSTQICLGHSNLSASKLPSQHVGYRVDYSWGETDRTLTNSVWGRKLCATQSPWQSSKPFQSRGYCYVDDGQSRAHRRILRGNTQLPRLPIRQSLTYYTRLSNFSAVVWNRCGRTSTPLAVSALRHGCAVRVSIVRNRNFSDKRYIFDISANSANGHAKKPSKHENTPPYEQARHNSN